MDGRTVSEKSGANYAPHIFSLEPEAKDATPKITKRRLVDAMRRLFAAKRIRVDHVDARGGRQARVLTLVQ